MKLSCLGSCNRLCDHLDWALGLGSDSLEEGYNKVIITTIKLNRDIKVLIILMFYVIKATTNLL